MAFHLPEDFPSLYSVHGLFVLHWAPMEIRPIRAITGNEMLLLALVSYVAPNRQESPAGAVSVSIPSSIIGLSLNPPVLDRNIWGGRADLEIYTTLLSWFFCHGAEMASAGGHTYFEEDWAFERQALLAELNRPVWDSVKPPGAAAHMGTMSAITPLRTTSEVFPTSVTVARELSRAILRFRAENQSWRQISETTGVTRVEAIRLAHDLDGVIDTIRTAA